jgi:Domain of unknown function (DUF5658)
MIFGAILFTLLAVLAQVGDLLTTERGIELRAREKNPVAVWLYARFGQWAFYGLKILAGLALVWSWFNLSIELYLVVCFLMFITGSYAVMNNTGVIQRILRRKKGL